MNQATKEFLELLVRTRDTADEMILRIEYDEKLRVYRENIQTLDITLDKVKRCDLVQEASGHFFNTSREFNRYCSLYPNNDKLFAEWCGSVYHNGKCCETKPLCYLSQLM